MNKKMTALAALMLCTVLITACGAAPLSDAFDEQTVMAKAEEVITMINARDYAGIEDIVEDSLKTNLSAQILKDALDPILDKAGEFSSFDSETVSGTTGKNGEDYAVCTVKSKYSGGTLTYTISFDKDYRIVGLYVK